MHRSTVAALIALSLCSPATAQSSNAALTASLQKALAIYVATRAKPEHISAMSLSISLHGRRTTSTSPQGARDTAEGERIVTPGNLWEIGSNTKAFTAAAILQLEAGKRLTIDGTIGQWLPQYPAWKNVTIRRLLDMTSGIPGYDLAPAMLTATAKSPKRNFTIAQLIAFVYPTNGSPTPAADQRLLVLEHQLHSRGTHYRTSDRAQLRK